MKTSAAERERNRAFRSRMRGAIKELRSTTSKEEAKQRLREVASILDKAASRGLIHRKNAARHKSRLSAFASKLA